MKGLYGLVTGGASGLGLATVRRFARKGASVVICDLPSSNGAEIAKELGDNVVFSSCDITSEEDALTAINLCATKFSNLNYLINCAELPCRERIYSDTTKSTHSLDTFLDVQKFNLVGTYNMVKHAAQGMCKSEADIDKQRGVIINMANIAAFEGQIGQVAYAASKGAIASMTLTIARDLSPFGIRCCSIAPGLFDTPLLGLVTEQVKASLAANVPFPKILGDPDDFANLAEFLIKNRMMNGETIRLDGALRMKP